MRVWHRGIPRCRYTFRIIRNDFLPTSWYVSLVLITGKGDVARPGLSSPFLLKKSVPPRTRKKRRRWTIFCSQQRPIGGKIRCKITTINQYNVLIDILSVALGDAGGIGRLWLSQSHISSAAHSVCVFTWLIVTRSAFSCCTCPMKLKLSHVKRIGIGQPRMCLLFGLLLCSGR